MTMTSTYSNQSTLPRLPIPSLEETLYRFERAVWALQTDSQRKETQRVTSAFLHGDGPKLQALLEQYDEDGRKSGKIGSYVEEFWNEAYLAPDCSTVLNLNPFFVLEDGPDPKTSHDQIGRAACLVFATLKFASLVKREELSPDVFKGRTLCMDQFKTIFGSCRVPITDHHDSVEVDPESTHIVVLKQNQMYYFQALWPDGTVAVDESDIKDILQAVENDSRDLDPKASAENALGVLTTLDRNSWAGARKDLIVSSTHNKKALQIVESALFVLVLDDFVPKNIYELASNMLHGTYEIVSAEGSIDYQAGTCCNRWYDKIQIIVCGDGSAGVNFEHSAMDGHTALRLASDIFAETVVSFAQSITKSVYDSDMIPSVLNAPVKRASGHPATNGTPVVDTQVKRLNFELPPSIIERIFYAETALGDQIVASDTFSLEFKEYGKKLITANKFSPDSFVQMSMLLAYYRLYGKIACMYESVLTKQFYHGRTEAMRSATPKAIAMCEIWCSNFSSKTEKLNALRAAIKEHSSLVKESASGKGVDRHLFALKCIAERNKLPLPHFFQSDPWKLLNHSILSTSNCGNPSLRFFGFGPVVPDGFGIGYIIRDNGLQYSVSTKFRQTERYVRALRQTLQKIGNLLTPVSCLTMETRPMTKTAHAIVTSKRSSMTEDDDELQYAEGMDFFGEGFDEFPTTTQNSSTNEFAKRAYGKMVRKKSVSKHILGSVGIGLSPSKEY